MIPAWTLAMEGVDNGKDENDQRSIHIQQTLVINTVSEIKNFAAVKPVVQLLYI